MFGPVPLADPMLPGPGGGLPGGMPGEEPPDFTRMNRAAILAWQERQRRQRTLRMLMMFLMVLLLMDGDEQQNRRNHRARQHIRRHNKNRQHWSKLGYLDDEGNLISPLPPEVYQSRVDEDGAVLRAITENPDSRYHELVKKNDGRDVEAELRKLIEEKLKAEAEKGMVAEEEKDDSEDKEGPKKGKDSGKEEDDAKMQVKVDISPRKSPSTATPNDEKAKEVDDVTLHHYPRNATGYYRGLWVRHPKNKTVGESEERDSKSKSKEDKEAKERNVTVDEIHTWLQTQLHQRKKDVGLLLLPRDTYLEPGRTVGNATADSDSDASNSHRVGPQRVGMGQRSFGASAADSDKKTPYLSISKDAGRAAFQLYSRPIPAMNEISTVDGLVKLYDGMTTSFVSRRTDVLLRVRGVIIHGIGKMSLVTTPMQGGMGRRRSVLGVRRIEKGEKHSESEDAEELDASEDEQEESSDRRRRLQDALEKVVSGAGAQSRDSHDQTRGLMGDVNEVVAQIRHEVMEMYSSHYQGNDDRLSKNPAQSRESMESAGWTLIQSLDEGLVHDDEANRAARHRSLAEEGSNIEDNLVAESSNEGNATMVVNGSLPVRFEKIQSVLAATQKRSMPEQYAFPFPYAMDDAEGSVKKASPHMTRRLPSREQALEVNSMNCEFEMNFDVQTTKWTYGEWRSSTEHRLRMDGVFNPYLNIAHSGSEKIKLKRPQYLLVMKSQLDFLEEQTPKEALVMQILGDIDSENCDFHSFVNVTAMRTNWEHTTGKAINYSFYMMLTCLTQIVILLRQLLHTQAQSVASNVSLMCIGWQTVLDAILCISHIFLCLVMQPLFTAFASVAFFKLLIFCVIEMKYMAIIIQARNNANNTGLTQEDLRRQVTLLHLKFYGALMFTILAFWYIGQSNRTLYVLLLYSFWVPQIILNVITESRKPLHPYYMYGMALTRSVAPMYVFAVKNNFLKEVNPDFPTEPKMVELLILWIAVQTAILFAQSKYGTRFMIPQRFLPPKYEYSRPIPASLLPRAASNSSNGSPSEIELGPLLNGDASPSRERSNGVARNLPHRTIEDAGRTSMSEDTPNTPTLDCVICYNEIDVNDRRGYMLAPCDHIFHRHCLEQWMEVKMECPICRCNLPSL
ncbi:hypothetical protein ACHAXT_008107 [Thalassiosira profunda]